MQLTARGKEMNEDAAKLVNDPNTLKYWYNFVFMDGSKIGGVIVGYLERNKISAMRLAEARQRANMPDSAILLSVSCLGRMTGAQFMAGMVPMVPAPLDDFSDEDETRPG